MFPLPARFCSFLHPLPAPAYWYLICQSASHLYDCQFDAGRVVALEPKFPAAKGPGNKAFFRKHDREYGASIVTRCEAYQMPRAVRFVAWRQLILQCNKLQEPRFSLGQATYWKN